MPTLPSASSAVRQRPSPGQVVEDVAPQGRDPALPGLADGLVDDVDAEHHVTRGSQRGGHPAGAAADVEGGPLAVAQDLAVVGVGLLGPLGDREVEGLVAEADDAAGRALERGGEDGGEGVVGQRHGAT